jgi:ribulose-bisphosphate carboxylase large chain
MASLNWCGHSGIQTLRRHTPLALHGHRNGYGALSRHPLLGISFQAYQTLWRLAGVDHMHVHGLQGKFAQPDEEVVASARDCFTPLAEGIDDRVMPAFSSGQWAGTVAATWDAVGSDDLLFMSGGGILAHPMGPAAGVASIRQAWAAARAGTPLADAARHAPELASALAFFGAR